MNCKSVSLAWLTAIGTLLVTLGGCARKPIQTIDYHRAYIDARTVLLQAANDSEPVTRAHAMEALSQTLADEAGAVYTQSLTDEYPAVRFAAAMAIGDIRYEPAKSILLAMSKHEGEDPRAERDKRVFCAVVFALYRMGDISATGELGQLLFDPEKEVRANVAMVMGRLGEESAKDPLQARLVDERDDSVRLQIIEALALLGDTRSTSLLEAFTRSQFLDDRLVAIGAMARVRSQATIRVLYEMLQEYQPPRVRVAAAGALAEMGQVSDATYELCLKSALDPYPAMKDRPGRAEVTDFEANSLQRLAVMSLGQMHRLAAVEVLHPLLNHTDGGVRVASAMSILKLVKAYKPQPEPAKPAPTTQAKPAPTTQPTTQPATQATTQPKPPEQPTVKLHTAGAKD